MTNSNIKINDYSVYDNYYSPIKYSFDGKTLNIHMYLDFVTYKEYIDSEGNKRYNRSAASYKIKHDNISYIDNYIQGLKEKYTIEVVEDKYEFKGVNFKVKPIIHLKGKEQYNKNQMFTEVLIGGDYPNVYEGREVSIWYQTWENFNRDSDILYKGVRIIYMPTVEQAKVKWSNEHLKLVISHEMGHFLGMDEGYDISYNETDEKTNKKYKVTVDRFLSSRETGRFIAKKDRNGDAYDNIMRESYIDTKLQPNDIEMIFLAYSDKKGKPWKWNLQAFITTSFFDTFNNYQRSINKSDAIISNVDLEDTNKRVEMKSRGE